MRMWKVNPKCLCRKHLMGEHVEMHMFVGTFNANKRIEGYLRNKLVEVDFIHQRHDILAEEMKSRGMNHQSPLGEFKYEGPNGVVDVEGNYRELCRRCPDCRERIMYYGVLKNE